VSVCSALSTALSFIYFDAGSILRIKKLDVQNISRKLEKLAKTR
jgi:hypothetical protein